MRWYRVQPGVESKTDQELQSERERVIAELKALPGPKPLRPISPEVMAELLADQMPYDEALREYQSLMDGGGVCLQPYLDELRNKYCVALSGTTRFEMTKSL